MKPYTPLTIFGSLYYAFFVQRYLNFEIVSLLDSYLLYCIVLAFVNLYQGQFLQLALFIVFDNRADSVKIKDDVESNNVSTSQKNALMFLVKIDVCKI